MQTRLVGPDHDIPMAILPSEAKGDLPALDPVQYAVVLTDRKQIVGFLRYEFDELGQLCDAGTWVASSLRGKGIGSRLWRYLLRKARPRAVWVRAVTPGGRALITGLVREFPRIRWTVAG
jgi:GNAT superfamily N-acetyltransferase